MALQAASNRRKTAIIAGIIGNLMEWYDFALYGFMASTISKLFFPEGNATASLLATYGIFAAGFIMRPLGSGLFGWLGDRLGRTKTMMISVILMAFPTFLLGVLPSYASIGIWASIGLVAIRLVQGLSVGGEFSSSVTYLVETAQAGKRALAGSWANVGSMAGMLLGSGAASLVISLLPDSQLLSWGWRLPFMLAGIFGIIAIILRRQLPKSEHFQHHSNNREKNSPIREAFTQNRTETIQGVLFASAYGVFFYIALVYIPTWVENFVGEDIQGMAMRFNTLAIVMVTVLVPVAGIISDRFIRRTHLLIAAFAAELLTAIPLFLWMHDGSTVSVGLTQIIAALFIAMPCGVAPALFVELFPTRDRLSGYSIAFNVGLGVVGGSTPMVATWLTEQSGITIAPAIYASVWAVVGIASMLWMKDRSREELR